MSTVTAQWISAIGDIATGVATIIALLTLISAIRVSKAEDTRMKAAQVRENLTILSQEIQLLYRLLNDGSALILGAVEIASDLRKQLGSSATPATFWNAISQKEPPILASVIRGWNLSRLTQRVEIAIEQINRARASLNGQLALVGYPADLLVAIVNDAYSPMIFYRMMTDHSELLIQDKRDNTSLDELFSSLTGELYGTAASYFAARYHQSAKQIADFVELAVNLLSDLDDEELVKVTRLPIKNTNRLTLTESTRATIGELTSRFPKEDLDKLRSLLRQIEVSISKENALTEFERIKKSEVPGSVT